MIWLTRFVVCWLCGVASLGAQAVTLRLAANEKLAEQAVAQTVLAEVYHQAGLDLIVTPLPPARANAENLDGTQDGEVARIESYGAKYPSLVRVRPAYYSLTTAVFAREDFSQNIKEKQDLRGYRLGVLRGVQHSLDATEGLPLVQVTQTAEQLYRLLASGRIDLAIDTGINGTYYIKKQNLIGLKEVGTLARLELFHYLNPRHRGLAAKIGTVIQKLIEKRELVPLVERQEKAYLASGVAP